jgi:VWFA-related protein
MRTATLFTSFALFTSFTLSTSFPLAQQAPVFRTRVEVVQLDVSVLDKHRQPVRGLTEKDFTILEDGKPQRIVGFSTFDMDDAAPPAVGWMRDVPPDVTTNELRPESRLWILVMDDALTPQIPFAIQSSRRIAASIIDRLGPADLAAVVFTGDNRKAQDFTGDKTKLRQAIDNFNPGLASYRFGLDSGGGSTQPARGRGEAAAGDAYSPGVDTDLYFQQSSARTLNSLAEFLIAVPNRRKAVFYISPGVSMDLAGTLPLNQDGDVPSGSICIMACGSPHQVLGTRLPPAAMVELLQRTEDTFRLAQRANVTFYPIDPTGLDGMREYLMSRLGPNNQGLARFKASVQQDYLAAAAANTGGRTVMNTNDFEPGITEIFEENKSYYLIGFEPTNTKVDGTLRRIQVKVNRPDVDVRTRSSYYAPEPEKPADKRNAKTTVTPEAAALAKAIGGILPNAGLPMKVSVAPFAVPGQRLATVTVVLGVRQPVPAGAAKTRITETTELQTSAFTPEGDPRGTQRHTARVVLRAGADGEAAYEVLARIDLPAGRYQLRLAAHNATSRKDGSVYADVTVPDYANIPFSASPVVLSATPGRVSAPRDLLASVLPIVPTAEREFAPADRVTAFLRLYQSAQKSIERVQLAIRIRDAQNQVRVSETQTIGADRFLSVAQLVEAPSSAPPLPTVAARGRPTPAAEAPDRFVNLALRTADVKYQLPLSKLSPGPHLLTFEATLGTTTIRRDVRFEVK